LTNAGENHNPITCLIQKNVCGIHQNVDSVYRIISCTCRLKRKGKRGFVW